MGKRSCFIKLLFGLIFAITAGVMFVVLSNMYIVHNMEKRIVSDAELKKINADCILILGAGVWEGNRPSIMLEERLKMGLDLYKKGFSSKILVSGDHGQTSYDEVNVMKKYLVDAGVPSQDIFMDHAGFTTYDSMYRAKAVFNVNTAVVVTQKYHLYRALYICDSLGIVAYGSDAYPYVSPYGRTQLLREWLARDKAIFSCMFKVNPKFLGGTIDIHGNGNLTNDNNH